MRRSFLLSILIHTALFLLIAVPLKLSPTHDTQKELIELEIVVKPEVTYETQSNKKKSIQRNDKHQIVDQMEEPINNEVPDQARFYSQNNQVVKKETRSVNRGEFKNVKTWKSFQPQSRFLKSFSEKSEQTKAHHTEVSEWGPQMKKKEIQENSETNSVNDTGDSASATLDYIPEIDVGLETLLSTKEFKYYTYFRRIRDQLNQHWTPKVKKSVLQVYAKGRGIASDKDLVTRTIVVLNSQGKLLKVLVIGNSGFRELDQAALEALKEAAPFKNPPKGMIDPDGLVRIRWDFIIEG
jgi:protein TonB